ncbi:MAG: glycosyltransferase family 4 protein [Deltaproteobacteria bacterium]|nr:glycosyltransferase family 4 protein [Deltaproteobacteria bacterium]
MRILYITLEDLSLHKGSVTHVKEIVAGLRERGHQVELIGRPWHSITLSSFFLWFSIFRKLPQYDVIYARDYHVAIIALLPRLLFSKRLVCEINGLANEEQKLKSRSIFNQVISFFILKAESIAIRICHLAICVTPQIASYFIQHFHCHPDKVKVIGNGVNTRKFFPIADLTLLTKLRNKFGIGEEDNLIVFIGNLAPWQGVEYLIQVAPFLLERTKNVKFLIVGEGIWKDKLKITVKESGLSSNFIFTGMVDYDQIPHYVNIADICVLPKQKLKSGYSPIKLYEYMACGKPIICSDAEGLEFIEKEGMGWIIDPENTNSFKKALEDLIQNRNLREKMGEKALSIARNRFDWEIKVAEVEKVLKELLA